MNKNMSLEDQFQFLSSYDLVDRYFDVILILYKSNDDNDNTSLEFVEAQETKTRKRNSSTAFYRYQKHTTH